MIALLLAAALLGPQEPAPESAPPQTYDECVAQGIALGKQGKLEEAGAALDRAVKMDAARPEAFVERGGLRFLEQRYEAAVADLERALALKEDAYARDLLASSLHLAGRSDDALASWNKLGQPVIGSLEIQGLQHTRDAVARREIGLSEGSLLDLAQLRASRLRLRELGVFDRVTLRPVPRGEGKADLEVALAERHGLYSSFPEAAVTTLVNAIGGRVRLRYSGLAGTAVSFGGQYRWQANRPEQSLFLEWPRPFGVPVYLRLQGFHGRQAYDFDGPLTRRSRGLDLALRHVFGSRTVGQLAIRTRERTYSRIDPAAPPGSIYGVEGGVERRLLDAYRHRVDASVRLFRTLPGSDVAFRRGFATLAYTTQLSKPDGTSLEPSVLASEVRWGSGGSETPVDEMFAPGGSLEMELPLRAHHQTDHGVLGRVPIGRSIVLANLEWRKRVLNASAAQLGLVAFVDAAHVGRTVTGRTQSFEDVGLGVRLALRGSAVVRVDWGHGLSDGNNALFVGLGQAF